MANVGQRPLVYSLFDLKIKKLTDQSANPETYSSNWVDLPGIRKLQIKIVTVSKEDVMGDGETVLEVGGEIDKLTFSSEVCSLDLPALSECMPCEVSSSGDTDYIQDVAVGEDRTYFMLKARAKSPQSGGAVFLTIWKCSLDGLDYSLEGKKVMLPSFSGSATQNNAGNLYRWEVSGTDSEIT